jgi:regulator of RNase E activity RraA
MTPLIVEARFSRPAPEVVREFLGLPDMAGLVSRAMDPMGIVGTIAACVLPPLSAGRRVVGPALTLRNVPSRYVPAHAWQHGMESRLAEREAYFVAHPGDVLVVDSGGRMIASNLGPNSAMLASSRGIVGAIVDGPVTGVAGIRQQEFPVWCRGATTVTGHHRNDTIEINGTVACANLQVSPGDLIVADDSGVTVVPSDVIGVVLEASLQMAHKARALAEAVATRAPADEIRETLKRIIVDETRGPHR